MCSTIHKCVLKNSKGMFGRRILLAMDSCENSKNRRLAFVHGLRDGLPIGLGYFTVSFSLGIIAKKGGLTPILGFVASFFTRASAGEYGVYTMILADAAYFEIVIISLITNLRYLLMSTALSQKFSSDTPLYKRILVGLCVTDEIFGISIAYPDNLEPAYTFGAFSVSTPMWALGTALGIFASDLLTNLAGSMSNPAVVSCTLTALGVALYGMFIAIIIPPGKKDKVVLLSVAVSFLLSYLVSVTPIFASLSAGMKTILLTIVISAVFAAIKPIKEETDEQ